MTDLQLPGVVQTRASCETVAYSYAAQVAPLAAADDVMAGLFDRLVTEASIAVPRPRIADLGCGPGWWTRRMAAAGADAVGVDLALPMARAVPGAPDYPFLVASATCLPFDHGSLDGASLWYVLHHLSDEAVHVALEEVRRACRRGAPVLIGGHLGEGVAVKSSGYGLPMEVLVAKRSAQWWESALASHSFTIAEHSIDGTHHVLWARR